MDLSTVDQYFELALDLPERERATLLDRLDAEAPEVGRALRSLLANSVKNPDFVCQAGVGGHRSVRPAATPKLEHIHHVAVQVDDVSTATEWYRARFGCEVEYEDRTWALLRFANLRLALVLPDRHPAHVALSRPDAGSFGTLEEHRDGTRSVYISDPWGNSIEILDSGSLPSDR